MNRNVRSLLLTFGLCSVSACNNHDVVLGSYLPADGGVHADAGHAITEPDAGNGADHDAAQPRKDGGDDHKPGDNTAGHSGAARLDAGRDAQVRHDGDDAGDH